MLKPRLHLRYISVAIGGISIPAMAAGGLSAEAAAMPSLTQSLIRMGAMLTLVVALIYGLAWLFRKTQQRMPSSKRHLSLIETLPLGKNERLCLVKSGDRYLLLGVSSQGVHSVGELPVGERPVNETPADTASTQIPGSGWQWAQQIMQRKV